MARLGAEDEEEREETGCMRLHMFEQPRHLAKSKLPVPNHLLTSRFTADRRIRVTKSGPASTVSRIPIYSGGNAKALDTMSLVEQVQLPTTTPTILSDGNKRRRRKLAESFYVRSKKLVKISGRDLSRFPAEIFQLPDVETLILSPEREGCLNFRLPTLPREIANLMKLHTLILDTNELNSIPKEIANLRRLETLILSNNHLTVLPLGFQQLENLKSLHLANNRFAEFPSQLCHLPSLCFLDLSDNSIVNLPNEIWLLSGHLETLMLVFNQIGHLPLTFSALTSLTTLWLGDNNISELPEDFGELSKLDWAAQPCSSNIDNNPLVHPPMVVCKAGVETIAKYFSELRESTAKLATKFKKKKQFHLPTSNSRKLMYT